MKKEKSKAKAPETDAAENTRETQSEEQDYVQNDEPIEQPVDKAAEYLALAQRVQADFDNFRKRNASVRADAVVDGKIEAIKGFLPIMDNLERALETERKAKTEGALMDGLEMILKQMQQLLSGLNVEEISAEGAEFNPNLHNAVMQSPAEDGQKKGCVAEVFQKGYKLGDKVIRYSMVRVTV